MQLTEDAGVEREESPTEEPLGEPLTEGHRQDQEARPVSHKHR